MQHNVSESFTDGGRLARKLKNLEPNMIKGESVVRQELSGLDKQMSELDSELEVNFRGIVGYPHWKSGVKKDIQCLQKQNGLFMKAIFLSFNVKEWIIENDLLVHRLKEDSSQATIQEVLDNFTSLLEKMQGLPPESSFICYEQAIAYNLSHLLLRGHINVLVGGIYKSTTILQQSLYRAIEAFKIDGYPRGTVAGTNDSAERDLFTPENIEHTLGILLPSLFEVVQNNSIGCAPLVLSSCLLAFLWLLDEEVSKAVDLLKLMQRKLKHLEEVNLSSTEQVPASRDPVCLFSLEHIPSVTNCVITTSTKDLTDVQNLLSVVTSLLAFAHFTIMEYDKVLETLADKIQTQDVGFNDLYLKGYTLYVRGEVDEALPCFQQCLSISEGQDKAAALNMLGCCCAMKGKYHTAVSKFRDALGYDFKQLEALFNITLQYRKLGNVTAEIQSLKLLKQVIQSREQERCYDVVVIPTDHNKKLEVELTVPPRFASASSMSSSGMTTELVTYTLAKRSAELDRFEEAAKYYVELLAKIVDMGAESVRNAKNLPSPIKLYQQCAFALVKAGRYEDAVTVCDKVLATVGSGESARKGGEDETSAIDKAPRKRPRSDDEREIMYSAEVVPDDVEMTMFKAEALVYLHQPLEAVQSLNRVLKALECVQPSSYYTKHNQNESDTEGQKKKRRKVDCAEDNDLTKEPSQNCEPNKLVKVKVQAYNQKASILEGLGQTHDALHQLHLSLEYLPDNPASVYKHTKLLFKLDQNKEAALNWLRFRGIRLHQHKGDLGSIKEALSSSIVKLLESEVTLEQVQEMDELSLKRWSVETDDPFHVL